MKANYTKPLLAIEMFSFTQSAARDCADNIPIGHVTQSNPNDCVWDMGGGAIVFMLDKGCTVDGNDANIVCYNNPGEGNYIFHS